MHEGCSYTYPPLPIARYSFIQLSELWSNVERKICVEVFSTVHLNMAMSRLSMRTFVKRMYTAMSILGTNSVFTGHLGKELFDAGVASQANVPDDKHITSLQHHIA